MNDTTVSNVPPRGTHDQILTPDLVLRSTNRARKDVSTWRTAIVAFESVYNPVTTPLFDLHTDIMLDAHLSGIIKKRISSVKNKKIVFKVGEDKLDVMDKLITSKVFGDVIKQFMMAKMNSRAGLEFIPGKKLAFNKVPIKHIDLKNQMITIDQWGSSGGSFYPDIRNIMVVGDPDDLGLLTVCGFYALLKKRTISNWAEYIELFGSPVMVMKYKGHDLQSKKAGDAILDKAGNSMKICIPEEMGLDIKDGKMSNGDGKLQELNVERLNQEMSMAILGNTETSTNGKGGTGGKSQVHSEEQKQLIKDDMDDVLDLLNSDQFLSILASYGYPVEGGNFEYTGEVDIEFLEKKLKIDLPLIQAGLPVTAKYLYDTYHIPEPKAGEKLVVLQAALPVDSFTEAEEIDENGDPKEKPKPKRAAKPKTTAVMVHNSASGMTAPEVKALMEQTLTDFFANALS